MPNIYRNKSSCSLRSERDRCRKTLLARKPLQVSHLSMGDLDMPQALGFGWEEAQELEREGQVAGEFLGLGCLAVT